MRTFPQLVHCWSKGLQQIFSCLNIFLFYFYLFIYFFANNGWTICKIRIVTSGTKWSLISSRLTCTSPVARNWQVMHSSSELWNWFGGDLGFSRKTLASNLWIWLHLVCSGNGTMGRAGTRRIRRRDILDLAKNGFRITLISVCAYVSQVIDPLQNCLFLCWLGKTK